MILAFVASGLTFLLTKNFFLAFLVFVGAAGYSVQKKKKSAPPLNPYESSETLFGPKSTDDMAYTGVSAADASPITVRLTVNGVETSSSRSSFGATNRKGALNWAGTGEVIDIGGYELRDPLTYWASEAPKVDEASCLDRKLSVGKPKQEAPGALGYWPSYARISPAQRANYLLWLAGGRRSSLDDIGYAFIFFYGLERRALVDGKDIDLIFNETSRLLDTYTHSGSFHGYLSRFLGYLTALRGLEDAQGVRMKWLIDAPHASLKPDNLALLLAWYHKHAKPVPADLAMFIAEQDARSSRSVVVERVPEQFKALFASKYQAKFGQGLLVKAGKSESLIQYRPASSSLYGSQIKAIRVPNVLALGSQFKGLIEIWQECIEELRTFARKSNSLSDSPSREAFEALPEALRAETDHPDREKWEALAAEFIDEEGVCLVPISRLAVIQTIEHRPKLTAKQSQSIASTAQFLGFCVEPDARIAGRNYGWDEKVALFRPQGKASLPEGNSYRAAALMLEMGMAIAAADGHMHAEELAFIEAFLEEKFLLESSENRRLRALLKVLTEQPSTASAVGKRLQGVLAEEQRETVARFLVGVAAANDGLHKKEVTALRTAYKALGVEESKLTALLDQMRRADSELTEVRIGQQGAEQGEALPPQPGSTVQAETLHLDEDLLRRIMAETVEVASLLGAAMGEEDEAADEAPNPVAVTTIVSDARFDGLDSRYHAILSKLLERAAWPKAEFDELMRQFNLMPSGVLEAINEWSDEHLGDFLLEEGDPVMVQAHLLKEAV